MKRDDDPMWMSEPKDERGETGAGLGVAEPSNESISDFEPTSFAKVEKSLASLGFFTPSSRRIKDQRVKRMSFTREIDGKRVEVSAEILPTIYGLPITADLDKYLALSEIITGLLQAMGKIANPIRFTSAELLRMLNKKVSSGKNYKDIVEWLDVMASTTIISNGVVYVAGKKRFVRDRFHVFTRAVSVGKELEDGTIADANYVWLSDWQLDNVNANFLLPIDLVTYRKLKNHIAKALVPLLQVWLFASHRAGSFEKRYEELCEILNLQMYKAPSRITQQFKPSLDELTAYGYLEKWRIEKTSDRKAYKIILFHGPKFHRDRRRRMAQKSALGPPTVIAQSEPSDPSLPEPGKVHAGAGGMGAHQSNNTRAPDGYVDSSLLETLTKRGVVRSVARKLLAAKSEEELLRVNDWVDYWDNIAPEKKQGVGLLVNFIQTNDTLPAGFETSRQRETKAAERDRFNQVRQAKQSLEFAYQEYREEAVDRYITQELPKDHYDQIFATHSHELSREGSFFEQYRDSPTFDKVVHSSVKAELLGTLNVISFMEFCQREGTRILAHHDIDPSDLGLTLTPAAEAPTHEASESTKISTVVLRK